MGGSDTESTTVQDRSTDVTTNTTTNIEELDIGLTGDRAVELVAVLTGAASREAQSIKEISLPITEAFAKSLPVNPTQIIAENAPFIIAGIAAIFAFRKLAK